MEENTKKNFGEEEITKLFSDSDINKMMDIAKKVLEETLSKEQEKLNEMTSEKSDIDKRREEGRNTLDIEERSELHRKSEELRQCIYSQQNVVLAYKHGGMSVSFTDKKGLEHTGIPIFTKISSEQIMFDEETILTDEKPPYIPVIDEDVFASHGYVFDAIRIGEDQYILAVNGYKESYTKEFRYAAEKKEHPSDQMQGYVIVTLDQLVLISEYYYAKAKATEYKKAEEKNRQEEEYYDTKVADSKKEAILNQKGYYRVLPAAVKKKVSEEKWNTLSWKEKESFYKPIKRHGSKKLNSKLEEDQMWVSFHKMYERFVDPTATEEKGQGLYKWVEKGYISKEAVELTLKASPTRLFGNPEVFEYWKWFRDTMNWKIADIAVQRTIESDMRRQAIETSFGDSNTNDMLKAELGILVKRQDGSKINPVEIEEVHDAWNKVEKAYGSLKKLAEDTNLKVSHTGKKFVFASKAVGMYVPEMGTIAVSNKYGDAQFSSTLAHECAHWFDNVIGKSQGKRYSCDDFESISGKIAGLMRRGMNKRSDSKYINATHECFARAFEQYFAIETYGDNATLIFSYTPFDKERFYFEEDHYLPKSVYESQMKPLIKEFFDKYSSFFKQNALISSDVMESGGIVSLHGKGFGNDILDFLLGQ